MGNAFIAMPGMDENAPFYNPAAINDYKKELNFRLISPVLDFSTSVISLTKDVIDMSKDINGLSDSDTSGKVERFRTFVNKHVGEFNAIDVRLPLIQVMHKWFALSVLADSRNTFSLRNRSFVNVEIQSRSDVGVVLGGAWSFFEDQMQVGLNVKPLYRGSIDRTITTDDIINNPNFSDIVSIKRGLGVGFDLGLKGKIPTFEMAWLDYIKPTVALTWQDIGNTRFQGGAPSTRQSISTGFALHHDFNGWEVHVANDFRQMNQDIGFLQMWNIGAEVFAPQLGFFRPSIRIGGNQGYITAGTSLDLRFFKLEFATYGEESGKFSSQKQLRRLAANLSFGF